MRAGRINTCNEEADTIWTTAVVLGVDLCAVADAVRDLGNGDRAIVGETGGERLLFHEVREDASVGGEASKSDTIVGVYWDDLLLIRRELFGITLQGVN